jgi:hypothetical protein
MTDDEEDLVTVREAAYLADIPVQRLYGWIRRGALAARSAEQGNRWGRTSSRGHQHGPPGQLVRLGEVQALATGEHTRGRP